MKTNTFSMNLEGKNKTGYEFNFYNQGERDLMGLIIFNIEGNDNLNYYLTPQAHEIKISTPQNFIYLIENKENNKIGQELEKQGYLKAVVEMDTENSSKTKNYRAFLVTPKVLNCVSSETSYELAKNKIMKGTEEVISLMFNQELANKYDVWNPMQLVEKYIASYNNEKGETTQKFKELENKMVDYLNGKKDIEDKTEKKQTTDLDDPFEKGQRVDYSDSPNYDDESFDNYTNDSFDDYE